MRFLFSYTHFLWYSIHAVRVLASGPVAVNWSTKSYGPDGPWQAVTVQVGTDSSGNALATVDLHPGGLYGSTINTNKLCGNTATLPQPCLAEPAGLYEPDNSTSVYQNGTNTSFIDQWLWGRRIAEDEDISERNIVDTIRMNTSGGILTAKNSSIAAVDVATISILGASYLVEVGHLALGAPGNGTFSYPDVVGQTFPAFLAANNSIPSNSFGLHYGSASLNVPGSLTWGGYDQSRVLGDVGTFNLENGDHCDMILSLLDVEIGVENGSSPFNASSFTGLLQLNSSNGQATNIIPTVPYIYMAPETCAAIAQHLPVVLSSYTNLYIWDTADPQFDNIIKSPSYLAFVFGTSGVGNLTIKVPFQLLNLTLDAAIVSPPQQYFPCQPFHASDGSNHYVLGKAFLQAAFLGINWEQNKFFVAQAPGPGTAAANHQPIEATDETITSNPISDFSSSWDQYWTPIEASSSSNASKAGTTTQASPHSTGSGFSSGAKAGIAVGVIVGAFGLAVALFFRFRRRKGGRVSSGQISMHKENDETSSAPGIFENSAPAAPLEKDGQGINDEIGGEGLSHEIGAGNQIHEMDELPGMERRLGYQ